MRRQLFNLLFKWVLNENIMRKQYSNNWKKKNCSKVQKLQIYNIDAGTEKKKKATAIDYRVDTSCTVYNACAYNIMFL